MPFGPTGFRSSAKRYKSLRQLEFCASPSGLDYACGRQLASLSRGAFFGETPILRNETSPGLLRAQTNGRLYSLPAARLQNFAK